MQFKIEDGVALHPAVRHAKAALVKVLDTVRNALRKHTPILRFFTLISLRSVSRRSAAMAASGARPIGVQTFP